MMVVGRLQLTSFGHEYVVTVAKCCLQQTDDCRRFIVLGNVVRAVTKISKFRGKYFGDNL